MTLAERLVAAMGRANINQADLARACGVKPPSVHGWLSGKAKFLRGENLLKAAEALGVSQQWLATGSGPMVDTSEGETRKPVEIDLENNPDYPTIRRVQFKLSAGATGFSVDYRGDMGPPIPFPKAWYERKGLTPSKLFATSVCNGSMEPGLYDGDTVVVNTAGTEPKDGRVFAVNYEGELVIKRLVRDDGQWWLSSDNPDQRRYPRKVCHEGVVLLGEIVHKQSERI